MFALERATTSRRAGVWTIIGLILVPLVVAGGFLWAGWNSNDRLDRIQAAIVNNDDPIKINGQTVPLGRQLSGGLVTADDDPNFSWVITDDQDAASGLASGAYAAVVTIPKDFSKNATSYSKDDSDKIHHATIDVETSQITGLADPVVGQAITAQATKVLNATLTEGYLKNIYIGFNKTGKQFATLASAAGKLSDGTGQLSDGIAKTASGTGKFADGLGQLDTGAQQLATGLGTYSDGVHTYADGVGKYSKGVDQLADGAGQSASGAKKLGTAGKKLSAGADQLADGANGLAGGLKTLQNGSKQTQGLGTASNAANVAKYQGAMAGLSKSSEAELTQAGFTCPEQLAANNQCAGFYAGINAGTGAAAQGATGLVQSAGALDQIVSGIRFGPDGKTGITAYAKGMQTFASGLGKYTDGVGQLATGLGKLASGTNKLATGGHALAKGGQQLATGADKISDGATQLASGTSQSADGAQKLYSGVSKLSDGGAKLADGTDKFATGLDKGKDQVPSFDKTLRNKLSSVVTTPVKTPTVTEIFPNDASTTLLTVMALWLGALASFLIIRAVPARVLTSMKPSWRLALEGVLPAALVGVVQAGVLTGVLSALLDLNASHTGALLGFSMLTAVAFAMINHALVAWFGGVGRFVSVIVVVIAAAGAITSALPEAFDTLSPFLPTTPALDGLRAIVSDGAGAGNAAALIGGWLIIGTVASILAVARRRVISPMSLAPLPA